MSDLGHIFTLAWVEWLITIELLGLAALPLAALLFRAFPDRGYGFSKPLGLLLVAFLNWWLGSALGLGNYPIVLWALCVVLAAGGVGLYASGLLAPPTDPRALVRILLTEEALFFAAFVLWSFVRAQNPDIYSTEKPMDFMLLQVSGMSHSFPPPDAWLSGQTVNYYYLGYAIFAMLGKMAAVDPRIGFNLANITVFALGAIGAYSLSLALTKSLRWAALGIFALILAGNLDGVAQAAGQLRNGGLNGQGLNLWCSTRIIDGGCSGYRTITEFPIFSLLWNDLHPHVIAIPFVLLALAFGVHALEVPPALDPALLGRYIRLATAAISLGALFAINSWDYPAYTVFVVAAMLVAIYRREGASRRALVETIAILPASLLCYIPYLLTVHSSTGIGIQANPSAFGDVLTVIGGVLAPTVIFAAWRACAALDEAQIPPPEGRTGAVVTMLRELPIGAGWWVVYASLLLSFVWSARTDFLYLQCLTLALYALLARRRVEAPALQATLLLAILGLSVLIAGDFVYLRDLFDNQSNYRMNTVFKLFFQAWIMFAVASSFAVCALTRAIRARAAMWLRGPWYALALGLAACLAVYPIEGVSSQARSAAVSRSLDGLAYLHDTDPDEYAVVTWVREHTTPTAVIAEAYGPDYWVDVPERASNKLSALTGRPTLIGWPSSHEALWRGAFGGSADAAASSTMLARREADIKTLYTSTDNQTLRRIFRQYHIAYVFVGPYERAGYSIDQRVMSVFRAMLVPVVTTPTAYLFRVPTGT